LGLKKIARLWARFFGHQRADWSAGWLAGWLVGPFYSENTRPFSPVLLLLK